MDGLAARLEKKSPGARSTIRKDRNVIPSSSGTICTSLRRRKRPIPRFP
jgi:hypothetical protein